MNTEDTEYKIKMGKGGKILSYLCKEGKDTYDNPVETKDYAVVEVCEGIAKLLDLEEIEIVIKSKQ
jgi:hypothetical protein